MEVTILSILFVLICVYHLVYVALHKPKTIGTIILTKDDAMYIELNDEESISKLKTSKYVTFNISRN